MTASERALTNGVLPNPPPPAPPKKIILTHRLNWQLKIGARLRNVSKIFGNISMTAQWVHHTRWYLIVSKLPRSTHREHA